MNDSIIVYRNPLEKALWEGQYAEYLVPIGCALLAFGALAYVGVTILGRMKFSSFKTHDKWLAAWLWISGVASTIVMYKMF